MKNRVASQMLVNYNKLYFVSLKDNLMYKTLSIEKFRAIKNQHFDLANYVTILAGWNATGKSTILGLLGNSSELKKEDGQTYSGKLFRAEFSELFKGSEEFDVSGSCKSELLWIDDNGNEDSKKFSITWQKGRFRIIPRSHDSSAKFKLPVIFLGLSRLYPIGELDDEDISSEYLTFKTESDKTWFFNNYNTIMLKQERINSVTSINVSSTRKNKSGINTDYYDWHTNSAGQDNLSQILLAILSFKNLKNNHPDTFKGGLLLIDELEATLHPNAQEHLFDLILKEARNLNIQVVFTTHSLTLIKKACDNVERCSKRKASKNNVSLYYFSFENDEVTIEKNCCYEDICNDLLVTKLPLKTKTEKIVVYMEDNEARWFLQQIIKGSGITTHINLRKVKIGCQSLIDLMNCEPSFKDYLVIFDGDLDSHSQARIKNNKDNYLLLPSKNKMSPEEIIWNFLNPNNDLSGFGNNLFYYENAKKINKRIKKEYFRNTPPASISGNKVKRDVYKDWFIKTKDVLTKTKVLDFWVKENQTLIDEFISDLKEKYNRIAKRKKLPTI